MVSRPRPCLRDIAARRQRVGACGFAFAVAIASPFGIAFESAAQADAEPARTLSEDEAPVPPEAKERTPPEAKGPTADAAPDAATSTEGPAAATDVVVSPVLSAETDEYTPRAETLSRLLFDEFQARGLELVPLALVEAPPASPLPACPNLACFRAVSGAASARFVIAGTLSRQSNADVLELVAYDATSERLRGRVRQTGRGESDFVGRTSEIVTQLLADAGLERAEKIVFIDVVKLGIPSVDPLEKSNTARSFPVLIVGGGVGAAVGVGLFGIGLLFGLTANANHGSALAATTQIDAAAFVDQRDLNGFVANSLFLVGTSLVVAGGVVAALGYEWGE